MTRRGASGGAAGARRGLGGRDSPGMREAGVDGVAEERAGQSGQLHAEPCGRSCAAVSTTRKWSCRTTWRRTRCGRWRWDARTGCTSAAPRPGRRSRRFSRSWNPAARLGVPVKEYLLDVLPGLDRSQALRGRPTHAEPLGSGPHLIRYCSGKSGRRPRAVPFASRQAQHHGLMDPEFVSPHELFPCMDLVQVARR